MVVLHRAQHMRRRVLTRPHVVRAANRAYFLVGRVD